MKGRVKELAHLASLLLSDTTVGGGGEAATVPSPVPVSLCAPGFINRTDRSISVCSGGTELLKALLASPLLARALVPLLETPTG